MFQYQVYTVNSWGIRGVTTDMGESAQDVLAKFRDMGYVKVEVAPAAPVNGYATNVAGVDYMPGDTASYNSRAALS